MSGIHVVLEFGRWCVPLIGDLGRSG